MEKVTVNIESIADAMEATMDGWEQYLNMETGEIVSLSDGTWSDRDEEDETLAEEIDTTDKYVRLPNQYEIHEYEIMEEFAYATPNPRNQENFVKKQRIGVRKMKLHIS